MENWDSVSGALYSDIVFINFITALPKPSFSLHFGIFLGFIRIIVICPGKKRHKLNQIFTVQITWNILSSIQECF